MPKTPTLSYEKAEKVSLRIMPTNWYNNYWVAHPLYISFSTLELYTQ